MEIIGIIILGLIILVVLKTYIFSDEAEKCFRTIWSMNKTNLFQEETSTFNKLFKKFDVDFKTSVKNENLDKLTQAAHMFDAKHPRNLGIFVAPIVEKKIKTEMYRHDKSEQYDKLLELRGERGAKMIDASLTDFNQETCVQHLRAMSEDDTEFNFEKLIEENCLDLAFMMAMVDGKIDEREPEAIRSSMCVTLAKNVNFSKYSNPQYLQDLSNKNPMRVADEIHINLAKLVTNSKYYPKSGPIAASTFEQSLIASLVTISAIDGEIHDNEVEFVTNVIDLFQMTPEYKTYILNAMSDAAARFTE